MRDVIITVLAEFLYFKNDQNSRSMEILEISNSEICNPKVIYTSRLIFMSDVYECMHVSRQISVSVCMCIFGMHQSPCMYGWMDGCVVCMHACLHECKHTHP